MALTATEYGEVRATLYRQGGGKEELKARPSLPNESQLKAAFDAIDARWENAKSTIKADIDAALGFTTTGALAGKIVLAWFTWKLTKGG